MKGRIGKQTYIHIYLQMKIYSRSMGTMWGNTTIPCTGICTLKCDTDLSENELQDSVGTSARD